MCKRCKHKNQRCITNIYGDAINEFNCRSVWVCLDCGSWIYKDELDANCKCVNFRRKGDIK